MYFLENLKTNIDMRVFFANPLETGPQIQEQTQAPKKGFEGADWFQKLGPEEQEKYKQLQTEREGIEAGIRYVGNHGNKLSSGLSKIAETEDPNDPEFQEFKQQINARLQSLGKEYSDLQKKGSDVQAQLEKIEGLQNSLQGELDRFEFASGVDYNSQTGKGEQMKFNNSNLEKITTEEFLQLPAEKRLQYVTKNNVDSERVASGEVKNIDITFTIDGNYDKKMYLETTAGQILPKEVREVKNGTQIYVRDGLKGEFYSGEQRLIIEEGTSINISRLGYEKELSEIEKKVQLQVEVFLEKNPTYSSEQYKDVIKQSFSMGLGEKELMFILKSSYEKLPELSLNEAKKILIVTKYLKYSGFLDGFDANNTIKNLQEIIQIINQYGEGLSYKIDKKGELSFQVDSEGLPIGIEKNPSLKKFTQLALSQIGVTEKNGGADKYFSQAGFGKMSSKSVPWCAAFVNWCLIKSGFKGTGSLAAKSFIESSGYGHVGIKLGNKILGGNQGNKVSLGNIYKPIVGYSIPTSEGLKVYKGKVPANKVPDGAIIVFDRNVKNKNYA